MNKKVSRSTGVIMSALLLVLAGASFAFAVPTFQVGLKAGTYGTNELPVTGGTDEDSFFQILDAQGEFGLNVAAALGPNTDRIDKIMLVGIAPLGYTPGVTIEGLGSPDDVVYVNPLPNPPSNHYPAKDGDVQYLLWNVDSFVVSSDDDNLINVPNFVDGTVGDKLGKIEMFNVMVSGTPWIHFDVKGSVTELVESLESYNIVGNPGSHDATLAMPTPEPGTVIGLGTFLGIGMLYGWRRRKQTAA